MWNSILLSMTLALPSLNLNDRFILGAEEDGTWVDLAVCSATNVMALDI